MGYNTDYQIILNRPFGEVGAYQNNAPKGVRTEALQFCSATEWGAASWSWEFSVCDF